MRLFHGILSVIILLLTAQELWSQTNLSGTIQDDRSEESLAAASIILSQENQVKYQATTDEAGRYEINEIQAGKYLIQVSYLGYEPYDLQFSCDGSSNQKIDFTLRTQAFDIVGLTVIGNAEGNYQRTGGALSHLPKEEISNIDPIGTQEALCRVSGVNGFSDDGMGNSRISIGIRGLNPRRSAKVLVLEDGIPIQPAIYLYSNMYYNPPVERLDEIEVIKGSSSILYGPQTMGGVVNYITRRPRSDFSGEFGMKGGTNGFLSSFVSIDGFGNSNYIPSIQLLYKRADGYRENNSFDQFNITSKLLIRSLPKRDLYLKANFNYEVSSATYTGLTHYSLLNDPRFNPKKFDEFQVGRFSLDLIQNRVFNKNFYASTKAYFSVLDRDWWRENDVFVTAEKYRSKNYQPGDEISVDDYANTFEQLTQDIVRVGNGKDNYGILRRFYNIGVEQTYSLSHPLGKKVEADLTVGGRLHFERFLDHYKFGFKPDERDGVHFYNDSVSVEGVMHDVIVRGKADSYETMAGSFFLSERIQFGKWTFNPGVRMELFEQSKVDRLRSSVYKDNTSFVILPGLGINYRWDRYNIFGGLHRGFTPPSSGTLAVLDFGSNEAKDFDLRPEKSWNFELGIRGRKGNLEFELAGFYLLIEDLIAAARGSIFQNLGKVYSSGFESDFYWRLSSSDKWSWAPDFFGNYTLLFTAVIDAHLNPSSFSPPEATDQGFVKIDGNEMPYAPRHTFAGGLIKELHLGTNKSVVLRTRVGIQYVSSSFTDYENLTITSQSGSTGLTDEHFLLNGGLFLEFKKRRLNFSITGKNILDNVYVGSRLHSSPSKADAVGSTGIIIGARRQINFGIKYYFK